MRRIILLRHAEAVAASAGEDFDRRLSDRGRAEMAVIAPALARMGALDAALVSSSARTVETWDLARPDLGEVALVLEPRIYEASPATLLSVLQNTDSAARSVILVGHNPGIHELALRFAGSVGAAHLRDMPTAAAALFETSAGNWGELETGIAFRELVTPRSLGMTGR